MKDKSLKENELTVEERKKLSLEILDLIAAFCKEKNIRYYLHAGSLLGAVRHKGFIPWDDDLDICMPRPDYEKFLHTFSHEELALSYYEYQKIRILPFMKIYSKRTYGTTPKEEPLPFGLGIDIFPIDGFPDDEKKLKEYFKKQDVLFHFFYLPSKTVEFKNNYRSTKLIYDIVRKIQKYTIFIFHKSSYYAKKLNANAKKNDFNKCEYAGCSIALYRRKMERIKRSVYENGMLMQFENKQYMVPTDYDAVLTSLYGSDYMTPPPEKDRDSKHMERYFWINK